MMPSSSEMLFILALFVLFFGIERLPKLARSLGMAKGEFQKGISDSRTMTEDDLDRGGKTESAEIVEKAEDAGVEIEGKSADEIKEELEDE
ncbi:MAG: twin-arginine translocase TatA/TatE family subunit [Euryarchaeota archaeon]|jgi:TatA/E family protein of Tat protein translocase|nr:twin-arginine translocase TatA/TatE family subunit [Euryarchaeota archaeon]